MGDIGAYICRLDETMKLIEVRSSMESRFSKEMNKRKPIWKDVATLLTENGFNRSPEQCSSMWSSLVKKYEVSAFFTNSCILSCILSNSIVSIDLKDAGSTRAQILPPLPEM